MGQNDTFGRSRYPASIGQPGHRIHIDIIKIIGIVLLFHQNDIKLIRVKY